MKTHNVFGAALTDTRVQIYPSVLMQSYIVQREDIQNQWQSYAR